MVGSLLTGVISAACGDDAENGEGPVVSAADVQAFYGLVPGTCLVYEYGNGLTATAVVEPSPANVFPDRDEVRWVLTAGAEGDIVRYLEPQAGGRLVMLREEMRPGGDLVTRVYAGEGGKEPVFADLRPAGGDTLTFAGSVFRTQDARPSFVVVTGGGTDEDPPLEDHRWEVVDEDADIGLDPPYDVTTQLTYRIERSEELGTAQFNFVPGVGFVGIQDFTPAFGGTASPGGGNLPNVFELRDARICRGDGTCEGDPPECPAAPGA